jgi:hypothetical protein
VRVGTWNLEEAEMGFNRIGDGMTSFSSFFPFFLTSFPFSFFFEKKKSSFIFLPLPLPSNNSKSYLRVTCISLKKLGDF